MSCGEDMTPTSKNESLKETIARLKATSKETKDFEQFGAIDDYKIADESKEMVASTTGIAFDDVMALHKCEWDTLYPENPERYKVVMDRLAELELLQRTSCVRIFKDDNVFNYLPFIHPMDPMNKLEEICDTDVTSMKKSASRYDAIYFNKHTAEAASTALSLTYGLVKAVASGTVQNGLAVVRPPGHHAMANEFCGYCYMNNVAVSARAILKEEALGVNRVLIFDFDVHHGQATQQMFYETNEVLYISIHRYEHGSFWPNLRQSNYDFIGNPYKAGFGFNVNIPLNITGCGDAEYMAIFTNIVLPMAYEYQPDLIIISAGYDACIGCPEGEMNVTPAFYGHMISLLSGLANGKVAVVLEGGYYLPSLAEGVALTFKALLNDPNGLLEPLGPPHPAIVAAINNVMGTLSPHWKCFSHQLRLPSKTDPIHQLVIRHERAAAEPPYPIQDCYPVPSQEKLDGVKKVMDVLKEKTRTLVRLPVGFTHAPVMLEHRPSSDTHPEHPDRLTAVYDLFKLYGLDKRCKYITHLNALFDDVILAHSKSYVEKLFERPLPPIKEICGGLTYTEAGDNSLRSSSVGAHDVYFSNGSCKAAMNAAGSVLALTKAVMREEIGAGVALVRPPGHHAEFDRAAGFCLINNVVVAAKWIKKYYTKERILIVDFDIHHGNGTQHAFYNDKKVLFISMHKFEKAHFYPGLQDGAATFTGAGEGMGFNVNIPFNNGKLGDADYMAVFHTIVLPIAYSFAPTVILISAGFDAGIYDRLGNYCVTPQAFGHFVSLLRPLAKGRIILAMEGGYNVNTLKYGMVMCTKALLGDPLPPLKFTEVCAAGKDAIREVICIQKEFWPVLEVVRPLTSEVSFIHLHNGTNLVEIDRPDKKRDTNLCDWNFALFPYEFGNVPAYYPDNY